MKKSTFIRKTNNRDHELTYVGSSLIKIKSGSKLGSED